MWTTYPRSAKCHNLVRSPELCVRISCPCATENRCRDPISFSAPEPSARKGHGDPRARQFLMCCALLLGVSVSVHQSAFGLQGGTAPPSDPLRPNVDHSPASELQAEGVGKAYAERAGRGDIKAAIEAGAVEVRRGKLPPGVTAITMKPATGPGVPIIVVPTDNITVWGPAIVHEFTHISANHPQLPVWGPHSATSLQSQGCYEQEAHCVALQSLYHLYNVGGTTLPCSVRDKILADARWEAIMCGFGPLGHGPTLAEPCPDFPYAQRLKCK